MNKEETIQHFLSNLFMVFNFEISEENIDVEKKKRLLDLIEIASLIISNQKIFLDEKPEFFIQEFLLNEITEIACSIHSEEIKEKNIEITPLKKEFLISADKHYFNEAIKYLIEELLEHVSLIQFDYDENKKTLQLIHNGKDIPQKSEEPLSSYLNMKDINKRKIGYQLALSILKFHKINVDFQEDRIILKLP